MEKISYKFAAALLALVMLLCLFVGCKREQGSGEISGSGTTSEETVPETPEDKAAKAEALKKRVIDLMESDNGESPDTLFDYFDGDYKISEIVKNNDFAASLDSIYQKNGTTVLKYAAGITIYRLVREDMQFTVNEQNGKYDLANIQELQAKFVPSVFYDFNIDVSMFYSTDKAEPDDTDDPELTADMLSVDESCQICSFSDEYMKEVARLLYDETDAPDADVEKYLNSCETDGTYFAEENKFLFLIKGKNDTLGEFEFTVTLQAGEDSIEQYSVKMKYEVEADGSKVPVTLEMSYSNMVYDGNKPVAAHIDVSIEATVQTVQQGTSVNVRSAQKYSIDMNVQDPSDPCFDVKFDTTVSANVMGQISQEQATITLTKTNKKSENFFYSGSSNGVQRLSFAGQMIYGTPDAPDTPAEVETLVKDELYKMSLGG